MTECGRFSALIALCHCNNPFTHLRYLVNPAYPATTRFDNTIKRIFFQESGYIREG